MSDTEEKRDSEHHDLEAQDAAEADASELEDAAPADAAPDVAELKDKMLRAMAEAENARRRAETSVAEARKFAVTGFARDLLPVVDNMNRALDAAPDVAQADNPLLANLLEGLRMVEKELLSALERHGVKRLEPRGERFDPNLHQAVAEIPAPGAPRGQVVEVTQAGYTIADRVLRAAMVVVSNGKGGEAPAADAPAAAPEAEPTKLDSEGGPGASIDTSA